MLCKKSLETVSIALPTFNGERYISEQLESFANQSWLPDELVICDDGSTDNTLRVVEEFSITAPFTVKIIRNSENLGYEQNFAKAIQQCTGNYIFLSDQDDKWFSNKVEFVLNTMKDNPKCWLLIHDGELTDEKLNPSRITKMAQIQNGYGHSSIISTGCLTVVRKELLAYALPIPRCSIGHDNWLHQLTSPLRNKRIVVCKTLQYIRRHESNTSSWIVNRTKPISRLDVFLAECQGASSL